MGDLWGVLLLVGQILFPVAILVGALFLAVIYLRTRRLRGALTERPDPTDLSPADRRSAHRAALWVAISGVFMPWVVGLAVKFHLDARGEPTYPLTSFLDPTAIVILLLATMTMWCWPFLLLAAWIRSRHFPRFWPGQPFKVRLRLARVTHAVGLAGGAVLFVPVFRAWDTMYIFVPLAAFLLGPLAAGYGVGRLLLRPRNRSSIDGRGKNV